LQQRTACRDTTRLGSALFPRPFWPTMRPRFSACVAMGKPKRKCREFRGEPDLTPSYRSGMYIRIEQGAGRMGRKRHTAEEIIGKLRTAEVGRGADLQARAPLRNGGGGHPAEIKLHRPTYMSSQRSPFKDRGLSHVTAPRPNVLSSCPCPRPTTRSASIIRISGIRIRASGY
jgi:hypothetical protein